MKKNFSAIINQEDSWFVAECPEVGVASQGETLFKALENLKEAVEIYLEEFPDAYKETRSVLTTFEVELDAIAS